jgi:two-component system clock-associated histidine kinase SasA
MLTPSPSGSPPPTCLQFLLFVDERPNSQENVKVICSYLEQVRDNLPFELQVLDIHEHPHLVEHFRLVATPSLVKVFPEPRQTLAGSNIVQQLAKWSPRWEKEWQTLALPRRAEVLAPSCPREISGVGYSGELMKMADELFQLKQERAELLEQLKFKDQILAMLAHDLRSPLTAASIAVDTLELIQNKPLTQRTPQLRTQLFSQARKQFQVMNRLITDILQASRNMNAQFQVNCQPLSLQGLFGEILTLYQEQFREKGLNVMADLPQDVPLVYGDEELIRQVAANLLDNAIKYTPTGGTITVALLHRTTQKVQVSVMDTGPGIPDSKRNSIFEGHFRLQRDEDKEGYGLGLSLCRKIIQAHYGQIWVDSVCGQGSAFHFTLPVHR